MGFQVGVKEVLASGGAPLASLILLSVYSIALIWERWRFYRRSLTGLKDYLGKVRKIIDEGNLSDAVSLSRSYRGLASAVVLTSLIGPTHREERKRYSQRAIDKAFSQLQARLSTLGTIASTAPFIGLFGTVIGVMRAFHDLASATGAGPGVVAIGISEALVCTAAGLFVAIPAVAAYNHFNQNSARFAEEMGWISEEILQHLAEKAKP